MMIDSIIISINLIGAECLMQNTDMKMMIVNYTSILFGVIILAYY